MDISLAYLKKVLKLGIALGCIPFVDLESSFGAYTPSNLKGFTSNAIDNGGFCYSFWMQYLAEEYYYKSTALIRQAVVPSAMVDSEGNLYTISLANLSSCEGIKFMLKKHIPSELSDNASKTTLRGASIYVDFFPWQLVNSSINCSINCKENPDLSKNKNDNSHFKNYIHNAFQSCIAQEVGKYSNYLYVFCYVPPTRYMYPSNSIDNEGILMLKIKKESMNIENNNNNDNEENSDNQKFYLGADNAVFRFDHQRPRRDSDSYAFGAECGNYQAWVDTDDSGTDHVHLNWIALETANDFSKSRAYQLYNNEVSIVSVSVSDYAGGRGLESRAIKYNGNIYTGYVDKGRFFLCKYSPTESNYKNTLSWSGRNTSPFEYMDHSAEACNAHTARHYRRPAKVGG